MQTPEVNPASEESLKEYDPTPVVRADHAEDTFTRIIEMQAAKIPSDVFLFGAISSIVLSLGFHVRRKYDESRFFGMWAPVLLTLGVYNKIVKLLRPQ